MKRKKIEKTVHVNLPCISAIRKLSKKLDFDSFDPGIVAGVAKFNVGDEIVLRRDHLNDKKLYLCTVSSIAENGDVNLSNETSGQIVVFNLNNPMNVRLFPK